MSVDQANSPAATSGSRGRLLVVLAVTVLILAMWNVAVRPHVPGGFHAAGGLTVSAALVGIAIWGGLGASDLGLSRGRLKSGLAWGGAAFGVVAAGITLALVVPASRAQFHNARGSVGLGLLLLQVLLTIPLGTVVVEELAFRGVLLGVLCRLTTPTRATVLASVAFGLWHADGVLQATHGGTLKAAEAALGIVLVTSVAGAVFCWLRIRSGSLIAPLLAHLAINTLGLVAAWIVTH
jgi:uncharacterized protein